MPPVSKDCKRNKFNEPIRTLHFDGFRKNVNNVICTAIWMRTENNNVDIIVTFVVITDNLL